MRPQRGAPGAPSAKAPDLRDTPASNAAATAWSLRLLAPLALLLVIAVVHAASHMDIGVDTWVSLAGGRQVIAHGVTLTDPFSFNSRAPEAPGGSGAARLLAWLHPTGWINQNWLTHVLLAWLVGSFGLDGLAAWKLGNYLLVAALLLLNAQRRRANPVVATLLVAGALLASRQFFEVRAQDVTNLLAATLMLLLTVAALGSRRAAWLVVPLFAVWGNVHGGFVWGLLALALFVAAGLAARQLGGRLLIVPSATLKTVAIAAAGALAAVVALSPYRLANLTHPLVISVSADAKVWRNVFEWLPLARGTTGERITFVLCAALAAVAAALTARRASSTRPARSGGRATEAVDPTRVLDLGSTAILVFTGVMAFESRRFLPMAYLVGAPLLAQWLTCAGERLLRGRPGKASQPAGAPARLARRLALPALWLAAATAAVVYAVPFAKVYLRPWPFDDRLASVADRVLLTIGEPWGACQFVALNHLQGRMWNFWEAGGFWAWCQPADPATGRIAAQIAIDGRAQAAYDVGVYRWHDLLEAGGPTGMQVESAGRQPGADEQAAIRSWVARRLGDDGIWLAHVAQRNADTQLARALLALPSWQVVYVDANHLLLADASTPQGRELAAGVDRGAAAFPDDVSALLTRSYRALRSAAPDGATRGLALARQAWALQPTTRAVGLAALAGLDPACAGEVAIFFQALIDDQLARGALYARRPGYYERLVGAATAARFLEQTAGARGDVEARKHAAGQRLWLAQEADRVSFMSEW
jgi:hypothetical protein